MKIKSFRFFSKPWVLFFGLIALLSTEIAIAHPDHQDILIKICNTNNRVAPSFTPDVCSTCHNVPNFADGTAKKTVYQEITNQPPNLMNLSEFCAPLTGSTEDYTLHSAAAPTLDRKTKVHNITLYAVEKDVVIKKGVTAHLWAYGYTPETASVPGPVIRVKVGDNVNVHLVNPSSNKYPHAIDFHASQTAMNKDMMPISPGNDHEYNFTADYAGVWMYHCGTPPALHHIASGMYGMVIVEPKEGLPKVDHEFALIQSEYYLTDNGDVDIAEVVKGNPNPNYVVFNGIPGQYKEHPIEVGTGKKVRIFLSNAGPSLDSSFHIIGTIFSRVIKEGTVLAPNNKGHYGGQAVDLSPSQGAIIELTTKVDGLYGIVTHAFNFVGKGAFGFLKSGDGDPFN